MTGQSDVLEIDGLVKVYDTGHRALNGLSLRVPHGSIFGFIGLNGAGKTTTIRIVAGLASRDGGTVRLFGRPLDPRDLELKRDVGYVLDEPLYFDWMSAGAYLRFVGTMYGLDPGSVNARTDELLHFFDLAEKGEDPIETFSTGMKKKVSLAAAVIHTPKLIILDEPLEGIDALAANAIKGALSFMASRDTAILITSHALDTVEKFCTHVGIIHGGKLVMQCRTDEIRTLVKSALSHQTFDSLEELFVETVSRTTTRPSLSFL